MCQEVHLSNFASLCRLTAGNFNIKWTPSRIFFWQHFKSPHGPPPSDFEEHPPPPMFSTPVGKPWGGNDFFWCLTFLEFEIFLIFFSTYVNTESWFLDALWHKFRNFEAKGKKHFLKYKRKTNITLIYAPVTLLNNVHWHNCKNFWDFTKTFLLWATTMEEG